MGTWGSDGSRPSEEDAALARRAAFRVIRSEDALSDEDVAAIEARDALAGYTRAPGWIGAGAMGSGT